MRRNAGGARHEDGGGQGAHAARWLVRLGGRVVAGRVARWAAHGPHADGAAMDGRGGAAADGGATAGGPYTVPATQSHDTPGVQGPASPVCDAPDAPDAGT